MRYYAENSNLSGEFRIIEAKTGNCIDWFNYKESELPKQDKQETIQALISKYEIKTIY